VRSTPPLSEKGFIKVLNLRYNFTKGISEELKELYPNIVPAPRPEGAKHLIHPEWLAGFVDGEGHFSIVTVEKESTNISPSSISYKV
jgi:hypothetical protein